jgi:hypothetical protein
MIDLRPYGKLRTILLLKETIRRWWGVELAFADARGYCLDHADGKIIPPANDFCRQALFSKDGFKRCNESVKIIGDRLKAGRGGAPAQVAPGETPTAFVHQCHLGFDVVSAPIWVRGELAGFLFTGGSWKEEASPGERAEQRRHVQPTSSPTESGALGLENDAERRREATGAKPPDFCRPKQPKAGYPKRIFAGATAPGTVRLNCRLSCRQRP